MYHFFPNYRQGVLDALARHPDWDITFIAGHSRPGQEGVPEAEHLNAIEVRNHWLRGAFLWQGGLLRELRRGDYDALVMLGSWMYTSTWVAAVYGRIAHKPVLFWTHGWIQAEDGLQGRIRRVFYRLADKLLLYGEAAADIGQSYGWASDDLIVVGNSLILPDLASAPEPFVPDQVADPERPYVVWSSRIIEEKKPLLAIDAIAAVINTDHPVNLVVVGSGPAEDKMRQAAASLGARSVHFCGPVHDQAELGSIFAGAAATVVPDWGGLTIPHSLLYGVPVIANDDASRNGPEYGFLDPGVNGSAFATGSVEALAAELHRWCYDKPMTAGQAAEISAQTREVASPDRGAERILAAIEACR